MENQGQFQDFSANQAPKSPAKRARMSACNECRLSHKACDRQRPCSRCVSSGMAEKCCDPSEDPRLARAKEFSQGMPPKRQKFAMMGGYPGDPSPMMIPYHMLFQQSPGGHIPVQPAMQGGMIQPWMGMNMLPNSGLPPNINAPMGTSQTLPPPPPPPHPTALPPQFAWPATDHQPQPHAVIGNRTFPTPPQMNGGGGFETTTAFPPMGAGTGGIGGGGNFQPNMSTQFQQQPQPSSDHFGLLSYAAEQHSQFPNRTLPPPTTNSTQSFLGGNCPDGNPNQSPSAPPPISWPFSIRSPPLSAAMAPPPPPLFPPSPNGAADSAQIPPASAPLLTVKPEPTERITAPIMWPMGQTGMGSAPQQDLFSSQKMPSTTLPPLSFLSSENRSGAAPMPWGGGGGVSAIHPQPAPQAVAQPAAAAMTFVPEFRHFPALVDRQTSQTLQLSTRHVQPDFSITGKLLGLLSEIGHNFASPTSSLIVQSIQNGDIIFTSPNVSTLSVDKTPQRHPSEDSQSKSELQPSLLTQIFTSDQLSMFQHGSQHHTENENTILQKGVKMQIRNGSEKLVTIGETRDLRVFVISQLGESDGEKNSGGASAAPDSL